MWTPFPEALPPNSQVSTKPGQAHLRVSLDATQSVRKTVLQLSFGVPGVPLFRQRIELETTGRWVRNLSVLNFETVPFLPMGISFNAKEILKAPTTSRDFEERIERDIATLRFLIKEVTLGSHASNGRS
jgi:hypothetical protein